MAKKLFLTKGIIIDELIDYVIKKQLICNNIEKPRIKLTTTVNPYTWNTFQKYANAKHLNYNSLIEDAMSKQYRNYKRKINLLSK